MIYNYILIIDHLYVGNTNPNKCCTLNSEHKHPFDGQYYNAHRSSCSWDSAEWHQLQDQTKQESYILEYKSLHKNHPVMCINWCVWGVLLTTQLALSASEILQLD